MEIKKETTLFKMLEDLRESFGKADLERLRQKHKVAHPEALEDAIKDAAKSLFMIALLSDDHWDKVLDDVQLRLMFILVIQMGELSSES